VRILLTGKNGQVGFELTRALAPLGQVIAVGRADCDLSDVDSLRSVIQKYQPDVIVNPAAYTAVDKAETEANLCQVINGDALAVIGEEAVKIGAVVVHYSTDYVFDGTKDGAYTEQDLTCPANVYGRAKLAGEQALQASGADFLTFRTSWVYGVHGVNFAKTMLRLAADREVLNVVADQIGAPTSAALIADVTAQILGQLQVRGRVGFPFGLYHLTALGAVSWCDYAKVVIAAAHEAGHVLKTKPEAVHPIPTAEYPALAVRPLNSRLDTQALQMTFDLNLPDWRDGLAHVLRYIL